MLSLEPGLGVTQEWKVCLIHIRPGLWSSLSFHIPQKEDSVFHLGKYTAGFQPCRPALLFQAAGATVSWLGAGVVGASKMSGTAERQRLTLSRGHQ